MPFTEKLLANAVIVIIGKTGQRMLLKLPMGIFFALNLY